MHILKQQIIYDVKVLKPQKQSMSCLNNTECSLRFPLISTFCFEKEKNSLFGAAVQSFRNCWEARNKIRKKSASCVWIQFSWLIFVLFLSEKFLWLSRDAQQVFDASARISFGDHSHRFIGSRVKISPSFRGKNQTTSRTSSENKRHW